ncbi:SLC13 family permease [bacterium]|nr:SLC13 family permease [bacterium]
MTVEIGLVFAVLGVAIVLFVTELLRVDVVAILVMISLPWLGLLEPREAFSGLASNAVIAVIGVMILGYGVDKSGVMNRIVVPIIKLAGNSEKKLLGMVSSVVGVFSAFVQNIGAAALFLPALMRISKKTDIPSSRLIMPVGFAAILGGTLSMVGSGPLIILNDLLRQGGLKPFGLFSVTPIGIILLAAGILYFLFLGKWVLPSKKPGKQDGSLQQELIETLDLPSTLYEITIPENSNFVGKTREEVQCWQKFGINLIAIAEGDEILYAPWRHTRFVGGQKLAVLGDKKGVEAFVNKFELILEDDLDEFKELQRGEEAGFAEVIIPPRSPIIGKTIRKIALRKNYNIEPIMLLSRMREERGDFSDQKLRAGDTLIIHGVWQYIRAMADRHRFVLATPVESGRIGKSKPILAMVCFLGAIALALSGLPLGLGLFSGAVAMILLGVVSIDEAYKAVDWRTVFLLAGLIPLGLAMDKTGAANFIANQIMQVLQGNHPIIILTAACVLSTLFSLFMSNVAAAVILVPLVISLAQLTGLDPRPLSLLVAVSAANSFILPTHQVNALLMSPGGYHNADYLKAGGIMTIIFIVIAVSFTYVFYM